MSILFNTHAHSVLTLLPTAIFKHAGPTFSRTRGHKGLGYTRSLLSLFILIYSVRLSSKRCHIEEVSSVRQYKALFHKEGVSVIVLADEKGHRKMLPSLRGIRDRGHLVSPIQGALPQGGRLDEQPKASCGQQLPKRIHSTTFTL
ncbi:hypothetical protein CDD81_6629 [Ophiocordyceps australis]|uniref:Uncharacterized protein n=1 Tax=Ophiocordyceps australis TaxID=1399860 RepID=A0A2C5X9D3_9HYPO|nr:hypothetical protein CDD81_6629 [Ophiocordyceps australis]